MAELPVSLLMAGYRLLSDVEAESGRLILSKDQVISEAQLAKLRNIARIHGINEPIRVLKNIPAKG